MTQMAEAHSMSAQNDEQALLYLLNICQKFSPVEFRRDYSAHFACCYK